MILSRKPDDALALLPVLPKASHRLGEGQRKNNRCTLRMTVRILLPPFAEGEPSARRGGGGSHMTAA